MSVNGGAPVTFTDPTRVFSNQNVTAVGFTDVTHGGDILGEFSSSFATYALATAIGPITDSEELIPGTVFPTTGGDFSLSTTGTNTATFTATTATAVPEPASLVLLGTALLGLAGLARRKGSR